MDRVQTVATSGVWVIWLCSALIVEVSAQQSLSLSLDAALDSGLSNGLIESTNTKIRLLTRTAFGFHGPQPLIALALLRTSFQKHLTRDSAI